MDFQQWIVSRPSHEKQSPAPPSRDISESRSSAPQEQSGHPMLRMEEEAQEAVEHQADRPDRRQEEYSCGGSNAIDFAGHVEVKRQSGHKGSGISR